MLPGRTFLPEDILAILRRRFWLILVPFAVASAATAVYTRQLPDLYRSEALISVLPPKLPANMVPAASATTTRLEDRIPAIRNEMLTRVRLERLIQDFDLYPVERRTGIMQDIVERMRTQIDVAPVAGSAIRVSFVGREPRTVQRVAERLSNYFVDESSSDRKALIEGTDSFLESAVKDAESRLVETERAVADYRRQHRGELPEDLNSNLQAVQTLTQQIQALTNRIDNAAERRLLIEKNIADLENQAEAAPLVEASGEGATTAQRLSAARAALVQLEITRKPDHPDVQQLQRVIRDLEARQEEELRNGPVSGMARLSPAEQARQAKIQNARDNLDELNRQVTRDQETIAQLRKNVAEYQRRAEAASLRQTDMVSMNRDYGTLSQLYSGLRSQKEQTNIAASLERREIGERFKIVDPAAMPVAPYSPNRQRMNMAGMVAGLGIGVLLVGLLEYRDSTFNTDDDLARVLGVQVLAVVPLMQTEAERKRAWRFRIARGTVLGGLVSGCLAIVAYTFIR